MHAKAESSRGGETLDELVGAYRNKFLEGFYVDDAKNVPTSLWRVFV